MEKSKWKMLHDVTILQGVARETMLTVSALHLTYPERNSRYQPKTGELALVLSGRARVIRRDGNKVIILSSLSTGDCLGLASLFGDKTPDTEVTFSSGAVILVIPRETVERLIDEDAVLSRNIITVLAQKVRFLNRKIAGYTAKGSGEKLYRHLVSLPRQEDGTVELGESMASLARRLGMGRASLYRAVDALMSEGKIDKQGTVLRVLPPEIQEET